jgi:hypothetical protein
MKRQKFETRKIYLRGELQREAALALIRNLPADDAHPLEVLIREEVKARGLDANGYYWLRLTEIAEQAWFNGRQFSKEVWHEYARQNLMPDTITTKDGEIRSKWIESPDGAPVVISTTNLERRCFAEYTEAVEAFGAGLGVHFSANPRDERKAA